jgi:hypothetical protein
MQPAETIRSEMERIRCDLHESVEGIVENARAMADWRCYVRSYPWAAVGAAAAVGYLIIPNRLEVIRPDAQTLAQLAKAQRLTVQPEAEPKPRGGMAASAFNFLAGIVMRNAMGYMGQQVAKYVDGLSTGKTYSSVTRHAAS